MRSKILHGVTIFLFLGPAVMGLSGCAEPSRVSPSQDVGAFFVAGTEAQYRALQCPTSGAVDLSAYDHLAGIKYPPTFQVDVLKEPPSRPYKPFAVLAYDPAPQAKPGEVEAGLMDKAREIGADAVILCNTGQPQLPGIPPTARGQAVAIKYIMMSPPPKKNNS